MQLLTNRSCPNSCAPCCCVPACNRAGLTPAELEDAVLRALKKAKSDQVSISAFNAAHWGHMSQQSGLRLVLCKPSELAVQGDAHAAQLGAFSWTDAPEPSQADRCFSREQMM